MTIPPAAEKLIAHLKAAAEVASEMEAAASDADRASLLVGLRDVADCASRVLVAFYGADRRHTVLQAHADRSRVPEPAPTLHLERTEARAVSGWARWHVLDAGGELVGIVVEDHEWIGHAYGPATYSVAHNPTGEAFGALWRSDGHPTPLEALAALAAHLAPPDGPERPGPA